MTKQDLITHVAERIDGNEYEVRKVVEAMIEEIEEALHMGETVIFRNFGTFSLKKRAPKMVMNISTGEKYAIPSTWRVVFKPGKNLK